MGPRGGSAAVRGGRDRDRNGPLSELATFGGAIERPYDNYVSSLLGATLRGAEEKLGIDTVVLDLREFVDSFDALVVTAGRNDRQVRSIADEIERQVDLVLDVKPLRVEGLATGEWVAIDYVDVIIHVFNEEHRDFYDLEHLWSAAPTFRPSLHRSE